MRECDLISAWDENPNYGIDIELVSHRVQVKYKGIIIADSDNVLLLKEQELKPKYYFPIDDIMSEHLCITDKISFNPFKGLATHWALVSESERIECAAWSYEDPFNKLIKIKNHIAFYPCDEIEFIVDLKKTNNFQNYHTLYYSENVALVMH